ncbi:DUF4145 domain-containing protein [Thalassospira xiamenensis]|uniref:DUF4145 domain-containing protein n=1 Tax=Thalassospira xiamenensis TaxID=220697 RepID=UPI001E492C12|nr:DUF4145 domain-containing protein [Thalassospira xiamenensis]MCD1593377.1 DUF4145 domain-containing protein [Thalassospira xiamenensis]
MQLTPTIKLDCPHCGIRNAAFTLKGQHNYAGNPIALQRSLTGSTTNILNQNCATALLICPSCNEAVVASARNGTITDLYPEIESENPDHLPSDVERYFEQGVDCLRKNYDAAGMMFRKSLEVGLGKKFPESKGRLVERIKALSKNGSLTQDLATWADHIRLEGNDAAHDEFTKSQAEELHEFTKLVLTYLFTLPEIAKRADAVRQAKKADAQAAPKT